MQPSEPDVIEPAPPATEVTPETTTTTTTDEKSTTAEKRARWKYRAKLILGLLFPFFLDSMDTTIIATALPHIAADFHKLNQQSWIVTAFTLTSTAFIPAFGQLSNVFGRHVTLQGVIFLMLIGSVLCAGAQTFEMLLVGRALTGVSSAGLLVMTTIILSDKVSLKENALQNTLFSLVSGLSYSVGPLIGGQLTNVSWRWCFIISIPLCIFAHLSVFFLLRSELVGPQPPLDSITGEALASPRTFVEKLGVIDWPGLCLFLTSCTAIILALTWGGSTYPWSSAPVITLWILGAALFAAFMVVEYQMEPGKWLEEKVRVPGKQAMIPARLFYEKDMMILAFLNFAAGATLYAMFYFISVYFALVEHYPAGKAGLQLLLYIPGIGAGVYAAIYLCNVSPRTTFPPLLLGHVALPIAVGVLTIALERRSIGLIYGMMALSGFGNGITFMPVPLHAIAVHPRHLAVVVGAIQFFEPFGGTVAMAVMGSVLNNKIAESGVAGEFAKGLVGNLDQISIGGAEGEEVVKEGVKWAFLAILPVVALAAVAVGFLGDVVIDGEVVREGGDGNGVNGQVTVEEGKGRRWGVVEYYKVWRKAAAKIRGRAQGGEGTST